MNDHRESAAVPLSVTALREEGPMTLRDVTRSTAIRMGWTLLYDDVDAVLRDQAERGEVVVECEAEDSRDTVWKAVEPGGRRV